MSTAIRTPKTTAPSTRAAPSAPKVTQPPSDVPIHEPLIDWRFLLADEHLGTVALAGPIRPPVRRALRGHADLVGQLGDPPTLPHDLAVLVQPTTAMVRWAVEGLAPAGAIRIEGLARRRRAKVRRILEGAGLEVTTWWHRPSTADTRCIISLDRPVAAATVLRTIAGRGRRAPLEVALARWGRPAAWSTNVALLALAGSDAGAPSTEQRPSDALASPGGDRPVALLTPRFSGSKAIIGVSTTPDGRQLARISKLARFQADDALLEREGAALDAFTASGNEGAAPTNHALLHDHGRSILVEDAAPGIPLDRRTVRRDLPAALAAGVRWLERVPVAAPSPLRSDGRAAELILAPIDAIAAMPWTDPGMRADLVGRARSALLGLADATLAAPFEHGDLSHPNLFLQPNGELVAIDFELARSAGLPLHDLTFFIGYLAESVARPNDEAALARAHREATGPGGWAEGAVADHLDRLGVDEAFRRRLILACWTRHLAGLTARAEFGTTDPHRYETLWRTALEDAEKDL